MSKVIELIVKQYDTITHPYPNFNGGLLDG